MARLALLLTSIAANAMPIPALASDCVSTSEIAASRAHWATVRNQPVAASENEKACRAFAVSFYESVTTRQAAATCIRSNDRQRDLAALDLEIEAFNAAIASKCGG
ncbi:hypothetical protein AC630_27920 [Bradyrhizobium sp. AS23.2]|nr:hypothetical protein AC630_27920 [Bradyrhizobium sp. AS23.2]